jgi:hypothetical protein
MGRARAVAITNNLLRIVIISFWFLLQYFDVSLQPPKLTAGNNRKFPEKISLRKYPFLANRQVGHTYFY